jgi:hypothetical protein
MQMVPSAPGAVVLIVATLDGVPPMVLKVRVLTEGARHRPSEVPGVWRQVPVALMLTGLPLEMVMVVEGLPVNATGPPTLRLPGAGALMVTAGEVRVRVVGATSLTSSSEVRLMSLVTETRFMSLVDVRPMVVEDVRPMLPLPVVARVMPPAPKVAKGLEVPATWSGRQGAWREGGV